VSRQYGDLSIGERRDLGTHAFTEEGIRTFAERFDPQPIHTDPDAAAAGPFGSVVASGWHTGAVSMRLLVEGYLSEVAVVAGAGLDELRWPTPVRPGDEMAARVEVVSTGGTADDDIDADADADPDSCAGADVDTDAGPDAGAGEVRLRVTGATERGTVIAYTAIALVRRA
jgi:acyl dehydratase